MPAIVLDHEDPEQETRIYERKSYGEHSADQQRRPGQCPQQCKRAQCHGKFQKRTRQNRLAIRGKNPRPFMGLQSSVLCKNRN